MKIAVSVIAATLTAATTPTRADAKTSASSFDRNKARNRRAIRVAGEGGGAEAAESCGGMKLSEDWGF
jgi:hypothetical protein